MARRKRKSSSGAKHGRAKRRTTPWQRPAPKKAKHKKLSPKQKSAARKRAKRAGRPYPNLVDNMREASKSKR